MRSLLTATLIGALALALVAPHAAAQAPLATPTLTLHLESPSDAVPAGSSVELKGRIQYFSDALTPQTHLNGVLVALSVASAPEWASALPTPQSVVLMPTAAFGSATAYAEETFTLKVVLAEGAPTGTPGDLVVEARSDGNSFTSPAWTDAHALIVAAATEPCHHPEESAATEPAAEDGLTAQTAAAAPAAQAGAWIAGGLGAVAAAGVAVALRRRLRH